MDPPRVTKIMVIMRTDATVLDIDYPFFQNNTQSMCIRSADSCHDFAEIVIFGQRKSDGVLNAYSMNLDDFFSHNWTSPRLCLIQSWCGPRHPARNIIPHPLKEVILIQDELGQLSVYDSSNSKSGLRSTSGLSIISAIPDYLEYNTFCWVPISNSLINQAPMCFF